jgi:hypothetical protein
MRFAVLAAALLSGCSSGAQAACNYDLYIYQPTNGPEVYAVVGEGRAAAVEVRGCGDASLLLDAEALVDRLQARRTGHDMNVVTIHGPGSRTYLDSCSGAGHDEDEDEEEAGDDRDNLVVLEGAGAAQMRRTLQTLDAAPRELREQMIDTLALRTCGRR